MRASAVLALAAALLAPAATRADMMDFLVGKRDMAVAQALKQGAREMYRPLPAEELRRLPQEARLQYVLDNIYWAKVEKRFDEGKASAKAAVEAMRLIADTATPAEFVALWSAVDGQFIAALNGDGSLRTTRRLEVSEGRSTTLYALSWADITAVLTDFRAYRKLAAKDLLELAAGGNFGACRVFEVLYDTGIGSNPFAGAQGLTWADVNGIGQGRGSPLATYKGRTVAIPLAENIVTGCQHIVSGGGDEAYRRATEGHFRAIAKDFPLPGPAKVESPSPAPASGR
ncbi:MAG: hypothetical protein AB7U30_07890 [Sulfuricellaceae bacterium]|jgi:hypothetical protein